MSMLNDKCKVMEEAPQSNVLVWGRWAEARRSACKATARRQGSQAVLASVLGPSHPRPSFPQC